MSGLSDKSLEGVRANLTKALQEHPLGDRHKISKGRRIPVVIYEAVGHHEPLKTYAELVSRWGDVELTNQAGRPFYRYRQIV